MISVCIATYNGEKYIKDQLLSILKQLNDEDEVIISDNGSNDDTLKIIEEINDKRIKIFINLEKKGYTPNFENALMKANGEYIILSDQDDIWLNTKVSSIMREFKKGYDFVYSDCVTVNNNFDIIQKSRIISLGIKKGFWRSLYKTRYLGCCMAFNRKVLNAILPFPKKYNILEHDTWISAVSNYYFKVKIIEEPLIYYRRHSENVSNGGLKNSKNIILIIWRRIYRLIKVLSIKNKIREEQ